MKKKFRILFAVPGLQGHLGPSMAIAKHLIQRGHTIGYCSGEPARSFVNKFGIQDFFSRNRYQSMIMDKKTLVRGLFEYWINAPQVYSVAAINECFQEMMLAVESFKPDIMYIDTYDFLAVAVADKYHIPYAHGSAAPIAYIEKDIPPLGTGWNINTPWLNRLKLIPIAGMAAPFMLRAYLNQKRAIKAIDNHWKTSNISGVSPYLYMLYMTDKIEYPRKLFVPQIFYVGPSILEPNESELPDFPWGRVDDSLPLIYIATGTLFAGHYQDFYRNVIKALSDSKFSIPVQVVMAIGKGQSIEKLGQIPSNVIVVPFAPQIKLLEKADLFVTHGGVNSVNESLIHGKPMLVVHWGGDRMEMAKRVEYHGAGISLDVDEATVGRIRKDVIALLKQPRYTRAAEGIMHSYKRCGGARTAADLIERLAETRKPILRRKGSPIVLEDSGNLPDVLEI